MSQRRRWIRSHEDGRHFGSNILSAPLSSPHPFTRQLMCLFVSSSKNDTGIISNLLISDALADSSHFALCLPLSLAPPKGPDLLLTGVICASSIDVVCWPIKIFEGNVYFLERIAPAACKPFWIRPFMCKNLPLWGIVQDLSVTECWFGPLQRKWRRSRGSSDFTNAEPSVAIGVQPSAPLLCFWHPSTFWLPVQEVMSLLYCGFSIMKVES